MWRDGTAPFSTFSSPGLSSGSSSVSPSLPDAIGEVGISVVIWARLLHSGVFGSRLLRSVSQLRGLLIYFACCTNADVQESPMSKWERERSRETAVCPTRGLLKLQ
jgi:hypothetical protein